MCESFYFRCSFYLQYIVAFLKSKWIFKVPQSSLNFTFSIYKVSIFLATKCLNKTRFMLFTVSPLSHLKYTMLSFPDASYFLWQRRKVRPRKVTFPRLHSRSVFELWLIPSPGVSNSKICTFLSAYVATIALWMKPQVTLRGMISGFSDELWQVGLPSN